MPRQGPRTAEQLKAHAREQRAYRVAHLDQNREYKQARYADRKAMFYTGECVDCGSTENLERDHVDPSTKLDDVSQLLTRSLAVLQAEADKTDLVCAKCHQKRTEARRQAALQQIAA